MSVTAVERNRQLTIGVTVVCLGLSIISLVLRVRARLTTAAKLWWDDYWMMLVLAVCFGMSANDFVGLAFGSGEHQSYLPGWKVINFMQNLYSFEILWSWGVLGVKVGILLFYWRVFPTRLFRTVVVLIGCFSVSIFLVNFFVFTFQCLPISRFWTPTGPGSCVKQDMYYLASAIINVIGDAIVLFAPLPAIWNLQTSRSKKWSLSFLFLLGTFVCLASVFRIVAVTQIDPKDFTYSNVAGGLWSTVEVEVGFICANLPATRPLFVRCFGWGGSSSYASGGGSRSAYGVMSSGHRYGTGRRFGEEDKYGAVELTRHRNGSDESNLVSSPSHAKGTTNAITVTTDVEIVRVDSISQDERRRNLMDVVESHSPL